MHKNRPNKNRQQISTDGFFVSSNQSRSSLNSFNKYHRPGINPSAPGRSVDAFSKSLDGFRSSAQPVMDPVNKRSRTTDVMDSFTEHKQRDVKKKNPIHASPPRFEAEQGRRKSRFGRKNKKDKLKKSRSRKQKIMLRTSAVFASMLLLIGGGLALRAYLISRNIFKGGGNSALLHNQDVDPSQLKGEGDGRINILVLGKGGAEQKDGPDLTDTIIVASIDPISHEAALLSIPRDFWVKSPSGGQTKINQVYFDAKHSALNSYSSNQRNTDEAKQKSESAGIDAMKKIVSDSMGVPIHYYAMIDFAGFKKAIDTVGGVDINVTEELTVQEQMWINGAYNLNVKAGQQHFDGMRALAFSRSRKTSAAGDFARAERQRAVMVALKDKVLSTGTLANPVKINQLMSDFGGQLSTDFSVNEMLRLYDIAKEIPSDKITSVGLDKLVGGDTINGLSVQIPKAGMFDYSEIQNFVRNVMRDSFLKKENAKIMILNGTTSAGVATKKSNELKSFGYNVTSVGDAPKKDYSKTILVDLRNGVNKYTKNYLEKRLGTTTVGSLPDNSINASDADFVIILGSNETNSIQN